MFCDDNEGVNTPNAEDRPGLSTQDWAKNIRNHTFPNFKHSETWSEEGLSFYAVLIVWFMVSNWEHVSTSDVCKPIPCVFILVSSYKLQCPPWKSYTSMVENTDWCRPHMFLHMSLMLFIFRRFARDQSS